MPPKESLGGLTPANRIFESSTKNELILYSTLLRVHVLHCSMDVLARSSAPSEVLHLTNIVCFSPCEEKAFCSLGVTAHHLFPLRVFIYQILKSWFLSR
jgi:hypothetical protein